MLPVKVSYVLSQTFVAMSTLQGHHRLPERNLAEPSQLGEDISRFRVR
jgi:hypothetical protein